MFVVTVNFIVKTEHNEAFRSLLLKNAEMSLSQEPGCLQFDVCLPENETNHYFLYELYETENDFVLHLQSEHFNHFNATTENWVVGKEIKQMRRIV